MESAAGGTSEDEGSEEEGQTNEEDAWQSALRETAKGFNDLLRNLQLMMQYCIIARQEHTIIGTKLKGIILEVERGRDELFIGVSTYESDFPKFITITTEGQSHIMVAQVDLMNLIVNIVEIDELQSNLLSVLADTTVNFSRGYIGMYKTLCHRRTPRTQRSLGGNAPFGYPAYPKEVGVRFPGSKPKTRVAARRSVKRRQVDNLDVQEEGEEEEQSIPIPKNRASLREISFPADSAIQTQGEKVKKDNNRIMANSTPQGLVLERDNGRDMSAQNASSDSEDEETIMKRRVVIQTEENRPSSEEIAAFQVKLSNRDRQNRTRRAYSHEMNMFILSWEPLVGLDPNASEVSEMACTLFREYGFLLTNKMMKDKYKLELKKKR